MDTDAETLSTTSTDEPTQVVFTSVGNPRRIRL